MSQLKSKKTAAKFLTSYQSHNNTTQVFELKTVVGSLTAT